MVVLYLFIGFVAAVIAAAPPGAANLVVINTSINQPARKATTIVLGAGIGEVLLSLIALHYTMNFANYFQQNPWIQITVFVLFLLVGIFFLLRNRLPLNPKKPSEKIKPSKFITGLFLAFVNPPVLLFWVLAFSIIQKHLLKVTDMSPWLVLFLFFSGVYLGKVITLYLYGRWGKKMMMKQNLSRNKKDIFVGLALVLVGCAQGIRFFIT